MFVYFWAKLYNIIWYKLNLVCLKITIFWGLRIAIICKNSAIPLQKQICKKIDSEQVREGNVKRTQY
jgi:hypothetical protein